MTTIRIPAKQARIQFGELLERARWGNERFLITKKAKPLAYITGVQEELNKKVQVKRGKVKQKKFPFKAYPLGIKIPLTREYMYYDERLDRTLGH